MRSGQASPQGILAVCGFLDVSLEQVLDAGPRLIAVLCQVRDPGNAGTVIRGADAFGADAVRVCQFVQACITVLPATG